MHAIGGNKQVIPASFNSAVVKRVDVHDLIIIIIIIILFSKQVI